MNKNFILATIAAIALVIILTFTIGNISKVDPKSQVTGPVNSPVIQDQNIPEANNYINDNTNILNESTEIALNTKLKAVSDSKTAEIAVLTVQSMNGLSIDEFAIRVGEKWKVGHKDSDDGIIIIIALNERKVKIETGRGSPITDGKAGAILDTYMVPLLKRGDWNDAVTAGIDALITEINEQL